VLEAWALRKVCLKLNRTTLIHLTTCHVSVGSVQGLNRGNNMPYGTGTYGTKVGRPPKKKKPVKKPVKR
jgi:hypothetical protein